MKINIVNPPKSTKGKNVADKKPKKRKRKAASSSTAPKRRRRRRSNPTHRRKRSASRRSNPNGILPGFMDMFKGVGGMFAGEMFAGWVAQRFGSGQLAFPGVPAAPLPTSPFAGTSWPIWTYFATALGGQFVGNWVGRTVGKDAERDFRKGVAMSIVRKLVYTEGFARQPWMQATFGNTLVRTTGGNTFYQAGAGQPYNAMMGLGQILEARPLDGANIMTASPLDGRIVGASPLDTGVGSGGRRYTPRRRRATLTTMGQYGPTQGAAQGAALWLRRGRSGNMYAR